MSNSIEFKEVQANGFTFQCRTCGLDQQGELVVFLHGYPETSITWEPAMRALAEKLSVGIPHVRVDFYEVEGKAYFGELTFAEESGFAEFRPRRWNYTFGDWIKLPEKSL